MTTYNTKKTQQRIIKKKNLRVDTKGIVQLPRIALSTGLGKYLKKYGIEFECYDCRYKKKKG